MKTIFAAAILTYCLLQVSGHTVKERLLHELIDDYEPAIDPGAIDMQMNIYLLCSWLDEDTGFVVSHAWEFYSWRDERLQWSPEEYDGINQMNLPSRYIWTPDIRQYNSMTSEVEIDKLNAVLSPDGTLVYVPRVTYRIPCSESDNKITCDMRIGSWSYDGNTVRLQVPEGSDAVDLSVYQSGCPLTVDSHTAQVVNHTYPCCDVPYPSLDVSVVYQKRP